MGASQVLEVILFQQWPQLLPTTILLVVTLLLLHRSWKYRSSCSKLLPPGPWCLPILGNLHQIGSLPHRSLSALARRHGPVMTIRLGTVPAVVFSSPEAAREALKTHDADCCSRPPSAGPRLLSYGYKDVIFSPYSDYVRDMRKLFILELLSRRRVQAACYARDVQVEKLVKNLTSIGKSPVPIADHIFATVDGIIGSFAFGGNYATEQFEGQFVQVLNESMNMLSSFSAEDFFPGALGRLVDHVTGIKARRDKIFKKLDGFFEQVVRQYEDSNRRKPAQYDDDDDDCASVLVQELVDLWKKPNNGGFSRDHVKAMLMNTFVGGNHTSSVTINWAMTELIRHPMVLNKAQCEIRAVGGSKERVQHDDMPSLKYLRMVVKETLRLHPPATLLVPRETLGRIQVAGHSIPAKTKIIVNAWAIGRDPSVWKDPEEFCPDRFQDVDIDFNGSHFELLPFGSGRRVCPGLAMGVANIEFILANLLYCFDWELPAGVRTQDVCMEEAGSLTFRKKTPLLLVPTRYNNACAFQ